MIQTRQCCQARDQSHRVAGDRVLFQCSAMPSNQPCRKWSGWWGACGMILLILSSSARSGESSIPASSTVPFDLRDTLATFRQTQTSRQFSPVVISVWSLPVSSNSYLFRTILPAKTTAQPTRSRLLRATLPQRRQSSLPQPIFWLLVPRVTHHGHVHAVCFTRGFVGACCGLLVVLMAVHESLCVVARPRPSWSLRAALVHSRSHVHLPSICEDVTYRSSCSLSLVIHVVCSDCAALLRTAQIFQLRLSSRDSQDLAKRVRPT